ncbi:ribosome assembly RNA-binding protein YhbY [Carnobacteriaceae bacterium zg-84]|uniref:ribosome assembly RNA-binding protein YhbY n=1 Tax=Granulicatella sp. zg-84 TaxID=2678503 RepID=UPI0013BED84A|nr:ribosome assembly RNA-binding protein YhbY [Granulicatella sp. zg-84]NEW65394.1 ribosome assembly RNA-binding protein YhbY [Granulicatella sp. zg-84]QMI85089.1 ribosome assembly RNA-binding protein YhbY [Carnobacteriaceae bacterium zg-84]QMI85107.1 ribosome assembly RNA-binding protein YhbY [Carnobacteriaceae bacterium zg-84]
MLTTKQVKFLKKEAHHLKPIFQIGKGGLNEDMLRQIGEAIEKRELIKINLLQNTMEDEEHVASVLTEMLHVHIVQIIGHTLVLYKVSSKEKYRRISVCVKEV